MRYRRTRFLAAAAITIAFLGGASSLSAQDPFSDKDDPIERIKLFESSEQGDSSSANAPTSSRSRYRSAAELRQARALYRANQRMARLEYNLWIGHEPLRPKFNAIPMMSSRYSPRRIYVPIYVRH